MKKIFLIGAMLALLLFVAGCGGNAHLVINETPVATIEPEPKLAPEPAPLPEPEPEVIEEVNKTEPGDEDVVEEEGSSALNFAVITLKDLRAFPEDVTIKVGGTVMWRSEETAFLHIIGWSKMPVKSVPLDFGDSWNYTFTEPGVIKWFSTARPTIQGVITIEE